jgi:hypothetical protein
VASKGFSPHCFHPATRSYPCLHCSSSAAAATALPLATVDKAWEQRTARGAQVPRAAQSAWREGSNLLQNSSRNYVHRHSKSCPRPKMLYFSWTAWTEIVGKVARLPGTLARRRRVHAAKKLVTFDRNVAGSLVPRNRRRKHCNCDVSYFRRCITLQIIR